MPRKLNFVRFCEQENDMEQIKLNNGVMMPGVGYGTWKAPTSEITIATVRDAIEAVTV